LNSGKDHYLGITHSVWKNGTSKVQNFELNHAIITEAVIIFFKKNKLYVYFSGNYKTIIEILNGLAGYLRIKFGTNQERLVFHLFFLF
jgi:hypothetical protein